MDIRADEISKILREQIGSHAVQVDVAEVGSVISLGANTRNGGPQNPVPRLV